MPRIYSGEDKISKVSNVALNFLNPFLNKSDKYSFLDIGCGNGRDIAFLSSRMNNLKIYGIDISLNDIEKARKLNSNKPDIKFECKDWKDLDNTQYDIIYMSGVYHFFNISERKAFIEKIKRILKPRGLFFISTLSSNDTQYFGKGETVIDDPDSFQSEWFLHFSSEAELREDFKFLKIFELLEFYHKNYAKDTEYHTMWILIGENINY